MSILEDVELKEKGKIAKENELIAEGENIGREKYRSELVDELNRQDRALQSQANFASQLEGNLPLWYNSPEVNTLPSEDTQEAMYDAIFNNNDPILPIYEGR